MSDRIELRGLRALGYHGALPGEQDGAQPFEIELDVEADLHPAGSSDDLSDTIDYGAVAENAVRIVTEERWQLLERMAERVAEAVLGTDGRIRGVSVTVRKLRPPVSGLGSAAVRITRRQRGLKRAFVGLGANLGDREDTLRQAVAALPDVVAVSPVYETEPVGGPPGQPPYLNLVVELATDQSPRQLLAVAQRLETHAGRVRDEHHGPRTLDVDLLWVEGVTVDEPDLTLPHPRMHERRFVLAPLADLAPELVPPGWKESAEGQVRRLGTL
ncbi:MAG: 2-amino-4-hydroxy-6-hydroxymethyldihydropteridine diphosphokinase [Acidimicrobiales bacterium]|nr:2-amino-4-hydroxy-6-hydroxymethyldihydropteridine diphosphokinase [Actinomycetota bacterium]